MRRSGVTASLRIRRRARRGATLVLMLCGVLVMFSFGLLWIGSFQNGGTGSLDGRFLKTVELSQALYDETMPSAQDAGLYGARLDL